MGITGRYDFKGIQKAASIGLNALLAATGWGAWLLASPLRPLLNLVEEWSINFLANRGLIVLNIGEIWIDGKLDQMALDRALEDGLRRVEQGRSTITPAEGQAIDDKVREAFDRDVDLPVSKLHDIQDPSIRAGSNSPL